MHMNSPLNRFAPRMALLCLPVLALGGCIRADGENPALANPSDAENLAFGNPSGALAATTPGSNALASQPDPDNVLLEKPEFALSYNKSNGGPNWVSWHLAKSDIGRSGRANDFRLNETLPRDWWIVPTDYHASGYDPGHQCPSGDRTSSAGTNSTTFLMWTPSKTTSSNRRFGRSGRKSKPTFTSWVSVDGDVGLKLRGSIEGDRLDAVVSGFAYQILEKVKRQFQ